MWLLERFGNFVDEHNQYELLFETKIELREYLKKQDIAAVNNLFYRGPEIICGRLVWINYRIVYLEFFRE